MGVDVRGTHRRRDAPAGLDELAEWSELVTTIHEIDERRDAARIAGSNGRARIAGGVVDRFGSADRSDERVIVASLCGRDNRRATLGRQLDGDRPHAAGGTN